MTKLTELDYKQIAKAEEIIGCDLDEAGKEELEEYHEVDTSIDLKKIKNMDKRDKARLVISNQEEVEYERELREVRKTNIQRLAKEVKKDEGDSKKVDALREMYLQVVKDNNSAPTVNVMLDTDNGKQQVKFDIDLVKKSAEARNIELKEEPIPPMI